MQKNLVEVIMGAVVLAVAAGVMFFAYEGSEVTDAAEGYDISAKFDNISGINIGSDVRIGGIKVGIVSAMELDEETYQAITTFRVRSKTKIPNDSTAAIASSGLLGEKFVQVVPGAEERMIGMGGEIAYTQSSVSLEELIGKLMFSNADSKTTTSQPSAPTSAE